MHSLIRSRWLALPFLALAAHAQDVQLADLTQPSPQPPNTTPLFGLAVDIRHDRIVVGAAHDSVGVGALGAVVGTARVFERQSSGAWTDVALLRGPNENTLDQFGISVALDDDRVLVGASLDENTTGVPECGRAHVFELQSGGQWSLAASLSEPSPVLNDYFGHAVALRGALALVGAPGRDATFVNQGACFVFERNLGGSWIQKAELFEPAPKLAAEFGFAVALSGQRALVGSPRGGSSGGGEAVIFEPNASGQWVAVATLTPSDGGATDMFGDAVALDGDRAVVGSYKHKHQGVQRGAVYVYERSSSGAWNEVAELRSAHGAAGDQFGASVAVEGDRVAIGARLSDVSAVDGGAAYVFERDAAGVWVEQPVLAAQSAAQGDAMGAAIALSDARCVVGAPFAVTDGLTIGHAYPFDLVPLEASVAAISVASGGSASLFVDAGFARAGELLLVLGSASGTTPGVPLGGGLVLPLKPDAYLDYTLKAPNQAPLSQSLQVLGAGGATVAAFTLPAGSAASLAGIAVQHAFVTIDAAAPAVTFASNAAAVQLVP